MAVSHVNRGLYRKQSASVSRITLQTEYICKQNMSADRVTFANRIASADKYNICQNM
ncbi:hypothetical protein [Anaerocolumna sp.]|uniref:hypothetical protein n=1 Tax=Anaerocolumna sp. TaxID=2041569 RepID=UPI0028AA79CA|nr:hypothetical protein [Anaerocolumna sp.]